MAERRQSGKLAVILHADVAGSTDLVRQNEQLAHERIQDTFRRFGDTITRYHGSVRELRGDALLAEFERASDAVTAALAFQDDQLEYLSSLNDAIRPAVRVGIAMGEVIIADDTITGEGVVLAQRLEQLAESGSVVIQGSAYEAIPGRFPFEYDNLGEHEVKGFDEPVRAYRARLKEGTNLPQPIPTVHRTRNTIIAFVSVAAVVVVVALMWFKPWEVRDEPASVERMAFPLPDKPSIAILPFSDLSDSDEHIYIADGLTENIIATLGKISGLFVIDRGAVARYSDGSIKAHQVSEELGVRYVLKGSVQKSGDRLRVTTTLVDTSTGHHVWSERYDRDITDLFSVQDEVTGRIVVELQVNLTEGEQARLRYDSTTNFDAWANQARAYEFLRRFTKEGNTKARELLESAVDLDPQYAFGWNLLAWTHWIDARFGYSESRERSFTRAEELAAKSVELDPELADAVSLLGAIHLYKREYDEALDKGRTAIELNPNNADIHATVAITTYSVGDWGETIKLLERAMRLSPYYPSWYLLYLGRAQTFQGDYKGAIATHEKGLARADSLKSGFHTALAFAHMEAGNEQRAREFMAQTLEVSPHYSASYVKKTNFFKDTNDLDRLIGALQKAGMPENPPLKLPDRPSIAVLPFTNISGDPDKEYLSDGLSENIITELSRFSQLFVISRQSTFSYKGKPVTVREVSEELGVRYVLEGSLQISGNQMRVTAQLVNAIEGNHLWAESYDRALDDIFKVQDEITQTIVATLVSNIDLSEFERIKTKPPNSLSAYEMVALGANHWFKYTEADNLRALELYEQALALDPEYAEVYRGLAWVYINGYRWGWSGSVSRDRSLELALEMAVKGVELAPFNHRLHQAQAFALLHAGRLEESLAAFDRALELNPNDASVLASTSEPLIYSGQFEEAIKRIKLAIRLNPYHPVWYLWNLGFAQYLAKDYDSAVQSFLQIKKMPNLARRQLAAAYVGMGDIEKAKSVMEEFLENDPDYTVEKLKLNFEGKFKNKADLNRFIDDVRAAGLPER